MEPPLTQAPPTSPSAGLDVPDADVIVVGAGLAGLSAAVRLRARGLTVRVVDPAPPGGKARTIEPMPGWRVEWGPHTFLHRADALWELAGELGIAESAVKLGAAAKDRYLVRGGKLKKAPFGALTVGEWLGLLGGLFRQPPHVPGESVYAWFARRFGESFARGPLDAMITGIWASDPADVEMDTAFPTIARLVREEGSVYGALRAALRAPRGPRPTGTYGFPRGLGTIAEAAVARIGADTFVTAHTERITRAEGRYVVHTEAGPLSAGAVVVAVEAPAAARLLAELAPDAVAPLSEVRYAPLAVAHWIAPDAAYPRAFGFLAPHAEARPTLGTIFVSDLYPDRVPASSGGASGAGATPERGGMRSFATMIGGARRPEDALVDEAEARRRVEAEHLALTGRPVTLTGFHLVRHATAVAPPSLGHAARLVCVRAALPPGLAVAGAWCGAGAMDDAIRAGFDAAAAIGASVRGAAAPAGPPQTTPSEIRDVG